MTKKELLDYLCAACDVENSIYACEEAISFLTKKRDELERTDIRKPVAPSKPEKRADYTYKPDSSDSDLFFFVALGTAIVCGIIAFFYFLADGDHWFWSLLSGGIIGFIAFYVPGWPIGLLVDHKKAVKKAEQRTIQYNRESAIQYSKDMATYNEQMAEYNQKLSLYAEQVRNKEQTLQKFENEIERLRDRIRTLDQLRLQLYAKRILHPNFCNIVAVNQLRDYLDMGIADQLDGNNGLYAQYLLDVRTQRICDSLEDLKSALERGLSGIASAMYSLSSSVKETKSAINAMETSLTANMSSMQQSITAAQNATSAQMQSYMD